MTIRTTSTEILSPSQRRDLESAVLSGRAAAEAAGQHEVSRLGVAADKAPAYLNEAERALRRELRAKARQLGDTVADTQPLPLLVADIAYEQWHRLLFAKFLEANGLLIHPGFGMPVTLEECEELAAEMEDVDAWTLAGRFASETLPGVFRLTDPCVKIRLAPEDLQRLERVIGGLSSEIFRCEDALGWIYQFWQTKRKKQVNDAGNKVGGADISPVTQLFTENYMVRFLLENSLGAWWASMHPESPLVNDWDYLHLSDDGVPLVGGYSQWPATAGEITVMDPCCGSGHFLVATFGMLWRMRAEEESLTPAEAQDAVLRDNLFGLELDPRCTQLATFNLVLEAWKQGGYRKLPAPNVACAGVPVRAAGSEWEDLAGEDTALRATLAKLHSQFRNADTLGSLINPAEQPESGALLGRTGSVESLDWARIRQALAAAVSREDAAGNVLGEVVGDVAVAASLLGRTYTLVLTNVPYLQRQSMAPLLVEYVDQYHPLAKADLATAFVERCLTLAGKDGCVAVVTPQQWLFLGSYKHLRQHLLRQHGIRAVARLGKGAFGQISGEVVNVVLSIIDGNSPIDDSFMGINAVNAPGVDGKILAIRDGAPVTVSQKSQYLNPDSRITLTEIDTSSLLQAHASGLNGTTTGDYPRYGRKFWEIQDFEKWAFQQSTVPSTMAYGGREHVVLWCNGSGPLQADIGATIRGKAALGRKGVAVSQMGKLPVSLYTGELFDNNTAVILPKDERDLPAIWAFCSSSEFNESVREIDDKMNVTNATLVKVPFDVERWRAIAEAAGPLPAPKSDDPTQWIFSGSPVSSTDPLQVAVARLLGYAWPDQIDDGLGTLADEDGIVCIPAVAGERNAADRLVDLLAEAYGAEWSSATRDALLVDAGGKAGEIEGWLRDKFFARHATLFHNRPFIWQIWDGQKDGFSALLHYHTLTRGKLEKLTYTILGAWLSRQREDVAGGVVGADLRLRAGEALQQKLQLVLQGEAPYDIYVRWKELSDQPVGWDPDFDDGIRLNIRPFVTAGVLRSKVSVKWDKDRGKNVDGTDRINDLHFTLLEKQSARG